MQMIRPLLLMYRISVNYGTFVKHICYVHKLRAILYVINIIICFLDAHKVYSEKWISNAAELQKWCYSATQTSLLHVTENGTTINYLTQKGWTVMKYNQVNDGAFMLGLSHITTTHPDWGGRGIRKGSRIAIGRVQ